VGKRVREGERVVLVLGRLLVRAPHLVRKVKDILPLFAPAAVALLRPLLRVHRHLHPKVEQAVRLRVIKQVELHSGALASVLHLEVEPLGVARCVYVVLHEQVVLGVAHFLRQEQVAALEFGLEEEGLVAGPEQVVHALVVPLELPLFEVDGGLDLRGQVLLLAAVLAQEKHLLQIQLVRVRERLCELARAAALQPRRISQVDELAQVALQNRAFAAGVGRRLLRACCGAAAHQLFLSVLFLVEQLFLPVLDLLSVRTTRF
jgi:hypothetical protein